MNNPENAPRPQEQPEEAVDQGPTPEDQLAQLQSEVGDWHPQQMDQKLSELNAQREQLRQRLDQEAEGKGRLSQWLQQAREKLGRLTAQEAADREQLHHLDEQSRIIQEQRIKAGVKPDSVSDNGLEAGFFDGGDPASETRVTVNETKDHTDLASLLARQQLEIIQSDGSEQAAKAIKKKYATQIQEAMVAAQTAGAEEGPTQKIGAYDQQKMAEESAQRTAPTEMLNRKMVIGETPENANVDQDEQATVQAREVATPDAPTEMVGTQEGLLEGDDSVSIGDTSVVGDTAAEPEFVMGAVETTPEPVVAEDDMATEMPAAEAETQIAREVTDEGAPTTVEDVSDEAVEFIENPEVMSENPLNNDIKAAVEADRKANEAIQRLKDDREALGVMIKSDFAIDNLDDMITWTAYEINTHLKSIADAKQWKVPQRNPQPKSATERFRNFLFSDEQQKDNRVSVDTVRQAVMQYRNLGREIKALENTDDVAEPRDGVIEMRQTGTANDREEFAMNGRANETPEEAVQRRLVEVTTQEPPAEDNQEKTAA
jgi:hypothetical protein